MQVIWHDGYAEVIGDEQEIQRATIKPEPYYKNSDKCTVPTDAELNTLWERAWIYITVDAANIYVLSRQIFLNEHGIDAKKAREIKINRIQERRRRGELVG
ncbi:hypothetical protein [Bacillus paramycoides]|uniref:hypothetical protein n=1 Tax=Bacillus paramycoides TaxID=2026194 RepID=UPI002E1B5882|nr:hypothetical protein [Bacillus paramycoides]